MKHTVLTEEQKKYLYAEAFKCLDKMNVLLDGITKRCEEKRDEASRNSRHTM